MYDREQKLWSELTSNFDGVDPACAEDYHIQMSAEAKTGAAIWWIRSASTNGVIIDHFYEDRSVGTIYCRNDLGFVEAVKDGGGKVLRTFRLAAAVEWVEEISTRA